ncbi:MAG: porin family protein [Flavisolibacter sp.]
MKKIMILASCLTAFAHISSAQSTQPSAMPPGFDQSNLKKMKPGIGLKAGYNFAKVVGTNTNFTPGNNNGFMVAGFFSPAVKSGMGYRTEIVFSRQGFSFDEAGKMQNVTQDYIYMPHLTTFTIAKKVQLQAGGQIGYLLNAKTSTSSSSSGSDHTMDYFNRIDYGFAGGVEVYPFKGLLLGGRYNVSFGNIYKNYSTGGGTTVPPSPLPFDPSQVKGKNAVVQFFLGYRF